ncbi:hypothetical protein AMS68_006593 [Peltaster fructicola]|uniref:FAS1 domain-containing protein n=1 Tax=Peltaster fructicola TaxID=286661 RepID=A0A6H0Y2A6_9PEZI|nr:hypothetical protein AMS68_006593 [Peltaster fructicola]
MRYSIVFTLAAVGSAFVVPSEQVLSDLAIEDSHRDSWYSEAVAAKDNVLSSFKKHFDEVTESSKKIWGEVSDTTSNAIDDAFSTIETAAHSANERIQDSAFDAQAWLDSGISDFEYSVEEPFEHHGPPKDHDRRPPPPPHQRPDDDEHHRRPGPPDGDDEHRRPPPHRRPPHHRRPHHPPHHKPNHTVYELIAHSKYTTKLTFLINQYPDLVKALNSTEANYTIFAPTDRAFEKIPEHAPKPSKEQIKKLLSYHVVPDFYPAGRVLVTHTVPTLLSSDSLGSEPLPQRLRLHVGLNGLTVNFYSHIVAVDIFGTNGVIHGVDSLILPPPRVIKIIDLLPAEFSTLELALGKTGLLEKLNTTDHAGGTLFAPSNNAFARLGPRVNAFLFSEHGLKYLKALLEYHVVPKNTLYSDAFYSADDKESMNIPKGRFHAELPTLLKDRSLSVDIARFGGFITIKINGFNRVAVQDGVAKDGVIHVVSNVIIPPRHVSGQKDLDFFEGDEIEVEELKERLAPYVNNYDL